MDILSNIEVRWLIEDVNGATASAAKTWFADVPPQPKREDRYLLTGRDDLGFKARVQSGQSSRLETKYLLGSLGPALLHERFVGNVERWRKLSVEVNDAALAQRGEWVKVAKSRRARKFSCASRVVKPIDTSARVDAGCLVEVAELEIEIAGDRRRAISVGIDAFGPAETLLDVLLRVCEIALEPAKGLQLGVERSESYPRWLTQLVASRERRT